MQPATAAIRKRTQISKTNRRMLLWIVAGSAVVGAAIVVTFFMGQKLVYNERVLAEKQKTISLLDANNKIVPTLETQVRALDANEALGKVKSKDSDQSIQVILDALPSDANSPALGASLQKVLLVGIDGLTIESLQVIPVSGIESLSDASSVDAVTTTNDALSGHQISFQFAVSGSPAALKQVLTNLERSIRAIDILTLRIETQGSTQLMTVQARAFYEPAKKVELIDKVVKP